MQLLLLVSFATNMSTQHW